MNNKIIYKNVYNEKKQLIEQSLDRRQLDETRFFSAGTATYTYAEDLYDKTTSPFIASSSFKYYQYRTSSIYTTDYNYEMNENDKPTKLTSTETTYRTGQGVYGELREGIVVESYSYDLKDNIISKIDNEGKQTNYKYNSFGKLILETSPKEKVVYEYDSNHLLSIAKYYNKYEDNTWKLERTKKYYYENKPYYYRQAATKIMGCTLSNCELVGDLGQYSNSGIY